jgi:hypothetical protein
VDKSLLIKEVTFDVGAPTSKFAPIFRIGKIRRPVVRQRLTRLAF